MPFLLHKWAALKIFNKNIILPKFHFQNPEKNQLYNGSQKSYFV